MSFGTRCEPRSRESNTRKYPYIFFGQKSAESYINYKHFTGPNNQSQMSSQTRPQKMTKRSRSKNRCLARGTFSGLQPSPARRWCRLEQLSRQLAQEEGCIITVKTASHPTLMMTTGTAVCTQPGTGASRLGRWCFWTYSVVVMFWCLAGGFIRFECSIISIVYDVWDDDPND